MESRPLVTLRVKLMVTVISFSLIPLFALGYFIYDQFSTTYTRQLSDNLRVIVENKRRSIDIFLEERLAQIRILAAAHAFEQLRDEKTLGQVFEILQSGAKSFVDLGIIDQNGDHVSYVGPFTHLKKVNYAHEEWFHSVMLRGVYTSDVFMGFRKFPHIVIAVLRREGARSWIMRATVDSDILNSLARSVQAGQNGDAFLVNAEGVLQTNSRFSGPSLARAELPELHRFTGVRVEDTSLGQRRVIAGSAWLDRMEWMLLVTVDPAEALSPLLSTHSLVLALVIGGAALILTGAFLVSGNITRKLMAAEQEKAALDASLMHSSKMAGLGKLAAGIAHEVNNPLTLIRESAGWMKDLLTEEDPAKMANFEEIVSLVDKIDQHVDRAKKVTHRMLGFARRMEPVRENVDLAHVAEQTVQFLENEALYHNIKIYKEYAQDLPVIVSDTAQLQQVCLNILENAIDAIGKDGSITVRTGLGDKADTVFLSISDTGPGIPPEALEKIFDPFFTTKSVGEGTGLGLSIAYGIIERLGGHIEAHSRPGQGATFTISLPVGEGTVA